MCTLSRCFHPWPPSLLLQPTSEWLDNWSCCVGGRRPGSSPLPLLHGPGSLHQSGPRAWSVKAQPQPGRWHPCLYIARSLQRALCFLLCHVGLFPFSCLQRGPALRAFMKIKGELELDKPASCRAAGSLQSSHLPIASCSVLPSHLPSSPGT